MDRGAWQATVHGITESDMTEWLSNNNLHKCPNTLSLLQLGDHDLLISEYSFYYWILGVPEWHLFDLKYWGNLGTGKELKASSRGSGEIYPNFLLENNLDHDKYNYVLSTYNLRVFRIFLNMSSLKVPFSQNNHNLIFVFLKLHINFFFFFFFWLLMQFIFHDNNILEWQS